MFVRGRGGLDHSAAVRIFNLMSRWATPHQWGEWLRAPLEHAAAAGDVAFVDKLLRAGVDAREGWRGCNGRTLLYAATQGGNIKVMSSLLSVGRQRRELNVRSGENMWSALHHVAFQGNEAGARELVKAGASIGSQDLHLRTPLHLALREGHMNLACDLLLFVYDPCGINAQDNEGNTALHIAVTLRQDKVISALLLKGADVNVVDHEGCTPLHLAAQHASVSTAKALLAAGANVALRNTAQMSAPGVAIVNDRLDILALLLQRDDRCALVHDRRADNKGSLLHIAAAYCRPRAIDMLVKAGGYVQDRKCNARWTPLHIAAKQGCCKTILALLLRGAKVNALTTAGKTPLMVLCEFLPERPEDAAELLLRWGAGETRVDREGNSTQLPIGSGIKVDSERLRRAKDMQRLSELLARAPANRRWHQRDFLVMCRAFPERLRPCVQKGGNSSTNNTHNNLTKSPPPVVGFGVDGVVRQDPPNVANNASTTTRTGAATAQAAVAAVAGGALERTNSRASVVTTVIGSCRRMGVSRPRRREVEVVAPPVEDERSAAIIAVCESHNAVEARVVGLADEFVFRDIMSFL